ncbi:ABC transporter ATP-binding protein [Seleniivibrio woodruffii]|uniref:ABC transporter ATP-binding protein n=1 Tax=Seleniivibrio woodruffii TaxID=1078050 RepID=UPI0026F23DA3|nr:ABC transporter ATP-binding protein [Seleniivibrio woodruffii]
MLNLKDIHKTYTADGVSSEVLKGVSIDVSEGEFVSIVGKSGSGKSTMMNIMSTLLEPDSGSIFFKGRELTQASSAEINSVRRNDISVIFQAYHLFPYLTAAENVLLPFMQGFAPIGKALREEAFEVLSRVGLSGKENRLPVKLSGGEQQRVAIARALIKKPSVLFADEPTGSLDSKTGNAIIDLLRELNAAGLAVVMVTHSPEYAKAGHTIVSMEDGLVSGIEKNAG